MIRTLIITALLTSVMALTASAGGDAPRTLTLMYSGNLDGELEPCGCTEYGNLGGIKRRATVIDQQIEKDPQTVVISAGGLLANEGSQDQLKSDYILRGFAQLHYDAIAVQWRDLSYGPAFIQNRKLPWVSSNWAGKESMPAVQQFKRGRQVVNFFAWLDPETSPMRGMQGDHELAHHDAQPMRTALKKAKANGELTIVATTLEFDTARALLPLENIDLLMIKSAYEVYGEPQMAGSTLVVQPGSRGMRLGKLELQLTDEGRIAGWRHDVIPMPPAIPDPPRLSAWYDEYNAKVKEDYLRRVEVRKQMENGDSPYVGVEVCKTCHAAQHTVWEKTEHPKAYTDLENVNKAFDPHCLVCHTVGFEKPGGFIDLELSDHLTGVQCESCHGPGKAHAESAGATPVANHGWPREKICAQCHTHEQSPTFDIQLYWPKIAH